MCLVCCLGRKIWTYGFLLLFTQDELKKSPNDYNTSTENSHSLKDFLFVGFDRICHQSIFPSYFSVCFRRSKHARMKFKLDAIG